MTDTLPSAAPVFVGPAPRSLWWSDQVDDPNAPESEEMDGSNDETRRSVATVAEANLIGSWCPPPINPADEHGHPQAVGIGNEWHLPCIDIDHPISVVESSTPGHHHLFIDVPMTWETYGRLLDALVEAGLVQRGYAEASASRGQTFVRARKSKPKKVALDA
jgi:hypothetical protein